MVSRVEIDEVRKLKYCGGHPWQTHDTESAAREIHGVKVGVANENIRGNPHMSNNEGRRASLSHA